MATHAPTTGEADSQPVRVTMFCRSWWAPTPPRTITDPDWSLERPFGLAPLHIAIIDVKEGWERVIAAQRTLQKAVVRSIELLSYLSERSGAASPDEQARTIHAVGRQLAEAAQAFLEEAQA